MKPERIEVEKTKLAGNVPLSDEFQALLEPVMNSTVLDVAGGIGRVSEYLSIRNKCDVTLLEANRLSFSYRRTIVPNTTVKAMNAEPSSIKLNKPAYDYVIIRGTEHYDLAKRVAKIGIVNLLTMEIENVVRSGKKSGPESKAPANTGTPEESSASSVQPPESEA